MCSAIPVQYLPGVLNSFLQLLEQDDSDSVILSATNLVSMLDGALFRRFDDVIEYTHPTPAMVENLIRNRLHTFLARRHDWNAIREAAAGLSHGEIARACNDAAKECILRDESKVTTASLVRVLSERRGPARAATPIGEQADP